MGFFSKLKKFWKAEDASNTVSPADAPAHDAQEAAAQPEPQPEAMAAPSADQPEPTPEFPAAATAAAELEAQSDAAPATPKDAPALQPEPIAAAPTESAPTQPTAEPDAAPLANAQPTPEAAPQSRPAPIAPATPVARPEPTQPVQAQPEPASHPQPAPAPQQTPATAPAAQAAAQPEAAFVPTAKPAPQPVAQPVAQPAAPTPPIARPAARPQAAAAPGQDDQAAWRNALILSLRQAEPKLSVWLEILLADVETAGPVLWERLNFLFESLEAPAGEADAFVAKFADWVKLMEYDEVELFRSELQYRLALALDLEDEEDERNRLFLKLSEGLSKTKDQIVKRIDGMLGRHAVIDEAFWDELEEILLMADVGFEPAAKLLGNLREKVRKRGTTDPGVFKEILREELSEIFRAPKTIRAINPPEVVMMIGVNGVGKTTTIAKLAHRDMMRGKKVLIAAGDTFRAAAIEQLQIWAKRVGAEFYSKGANSDPAAVAFEAMDKALAEGFDVLYLDTAGRLHTKTNLMEELHKIHRVVGKKHPGAPHRSVLVLDATTGQNALSQVKLFKEAAGVDEIILTKLDGTAKGGVVVGIALSFGVPITYIGLGEKMEDLRPFDGQDFAQALLGVDGD